MIHEKEFMSLKETNAGDSSGVFYTCSFDRESMFSYTKRYERLLSDLI